MPEPTISLRELRELGEAWRVEITTPGHYGTEAWSALEDAVFGEGPTVLLALVEAVEAAKALNYGSFGAASRDRLADALARFEASS